MGSRGILVGRLHILAVASVYLWNLFSYWTKICFCQKLQNIFETETFGEKFCAYLIDPAENRRILERSKTAQDAD